jgi:hypothetical protein
MARPSIRGSGTLPIDKLIGLLVAQCGEPARLLELYYWSMEPDLLPLVRNLLAMPGEARTQLGEFLRNAEPAAVHATLEATGRLRLSVKRDAASLRSRQAA